jgi:hypothetical protein
MSYERARAACAAFGPDFSLPRVDQLASLRPQVLGPVAEPFWLEHDPEAARPQKPRTTPALPSAFEVPRTRTHVPNPDKPGEQMPPPVSVEPVVTIATGHHVLCIRE